MRKYYDVSMYGNMMCAWNALPAYPEWSEDWGQVWEEHLAGNEPYLLEWFRHQTESIGATAGRPIAIASSAGVPDRRRPTASA